VSDDDDGLVWEWKDLLGLMVGALLIQRGRLPSFETYMRERKQGETLEAWTRRHISRTEFYTVRREVDRMTPEQRSEFMKPVFGQFDA